MKKIIILLTAVTLLASCSKDDGDIKPTYQTLAGLWKFKSITRADGAVVPFEGHCSTKQDYLQIFAYRKITTYNYYPDCVDTQNWGTSEYSMDSDGLIYTGGVIFDEATVTHLSGSGFTIEYAVPTDLNFMVDINDAKAITFEKM